MKSARYTTVTCEKCKHHRYSSSIYWDGTFVSTWVYVWSASALDFGYDTRPLFGGCLGCCRVGVNQALVLAITLFKLDINPPGFTFPWPLYTMNRPYKGNYETYLNYVSPKILGQYYNQYMRERSNDE